MKLSGAVSWKFAVLTSPEAPATSGKCAPAALSSWWATDRTRLRPDPSHISLQRLPPPPGQATMHFVGPAIGVTIGVGLTTAVMPAALYVLGFTKAGIAAGSMAARMMSVVAMANGGQVAAASLVATAQSLAMGKKTKGAAIGAAVGVGVALVGIPAGICALGFTATGIAAGSVAAKMMSVAAIANNGGVAAGSAVAVLQSIGAAGFSLGAKIGLSSALGSLGATTGASLFKGEEPPGDEPKQSQEGA
ncbi:interferon alpha-inducible protein 27-like protein 2B [Balearica regulorum gibbericeps]|uniref:interferon alpha-inducible protein 27-like protein 2B n=1 Tax=Balearica regulorum gibbericeps TaxID=100784 RepID=UPI003F5E5FCB